MYKQKVKDKTIFNIHPYKRVKTPTILQMEVVECGAACLAMILAYYKKYVPLEQLRIECGVARDGVRASNIVKAAKKLGMQAKGYRKEPEALANIKPPVIIHWNFNHFVIFEGFHNRKAYINDPSYGRRSLSMEEFDLAFTGVVLTFTPTEEFTCGGQRKSIIDSLNKRLRSVQSVMIYLIIIGLLMVIPGLIIPSFSKIFIDDILLAGRTDWLKPLLWCMGATALMQALLTYTQQRYLLRMETKIALIGASSFLWHILRLPVVFFQQRSAGDISSRMSSNDTVAAFLSRELAENVLNLVTLIFYFGVMLQYSRLLAILSLILALVSIFYFIYTAQKIESINNKAMQDYGKLYGTSVSGLYIIETLKATASESGFFSKWAGYHAKQLNGQQKMGHVSQILYALPNFMSLTAEALVLCLGGWQILDGNLTVGSLIAFQGLLGNFMSPINGLTQMGIRIKRLKGDMTRLDDVMKYTIDPVSDPERDQPAEEMDEASFYKLSGKLEIKNMSFGYNLLENPLIENFNLTVSPGQRIAIVGPSGSGKSTVAQLLAGLIQPWSGEILLDGIQRNQLSRNIINNSLSVVDQDISMFEGTVMDNITMWDGTLSESDIIQAAKDACIHDDITRRTGGYQGVVDEGGHNFSGGQLQRLEIARALATNPSIIIMDEATSALDVQIEAQVSDNIRRRGCTCIIIAHRLSTIRDCDEIIVMQEGKIVQRGTHDEMKDVPGLYATLIQTAV